MRAFSKPNDWIRKIIKKIVFRFFGSFFYDSILYKVKLSDIKTGRFDNEKEIEFLKFYIQKGDAVIDVGANFGNYVYNLSKLVPLGIVHAFEPVNTTFGILHKIVIKLKLRNVKLYNLGCSDQDTTMKFILPLQDFGARDPGIAYMTVKSPTLVQNSAFETTECDVVSLDQFLPFLKNLTFIKCDVEGAEFLVIKGAKEIIRKFNPVILCEIAPDHYNRFDYTLIDFQNYMLNMDYSFGIYTGNPSNALKPLKDILSYSGNCFFIPNCKKEQFFSLP